MLVLLVLSYQNCGSDFLAGNSKKNPGSFITTGNGQGYDGKLSDRYYYLDPYFTCVPASMVTQQKAQAYIDVSIDNDGSTKSSIDGECGVDTDDVSSNSIFSSIYNNRLIYHRSFSNPHIFESYGPSAPSPAQISNPINAWCMAELPDGKVLDIPIRRTGYKKSQILVNIGTPIGAGKASIEFLGSIDTIPEIGFDKITYASPAIEIEIQRTYADGLLPRIAPFNVSMNEAEITIKLNDQEIAINGGCFLDGLE